MKLTNQQQRFVEEYLLDLNASDAAIRAGYKHRQCGRRLMTVEKVLDAVQAAKAERSQRTQVNADYVLKRLVEIDQMDCLDILNDDGSVKPVREWPQIWRQFVSGFDVAELFTGGGEDRELAGMLKKIKWPDKIKNLELIGKHVNVQAFRDKVEWSGPNGGPIQHEVKDGLAHFYGGQLPNAQPKPSGLLADASEE